MVQGKQDGLDSCSVAPQTHTKGHPCHDKGRRDGGILSPYIPSINLSPEKII